MQRCFPIIFLQDPPPKPAVAPSRKFPPYSFPTCNARPQQTLLAARCQRRFPVTSSVIVLPWPVLFFFFWSFRVPPFLLFCQVIGLAAFPATREVGDGCRFFRSCFSLFSPELRNSSPPFDPPRQSLALFHFLWSRPPLFRSRHQFRVGTTSIG